MKESLLLQTIGLTLALTILSGCATQTLQAAPQVRIPEPPPQAMVQEEANFRKRLLDFFGVSPQEQTELLED